MCVRKYEKRAVHVIIRQRPGRAGPGRAGQGRAACRQTQKGTFTLNSNRPVSGAGSGIVAGPDRVRRGHKRGKRQGGGR